MTRDDTKLAYYSGWDIDQLAATDTVTVGSGTTAIYTIPSTLPAIPVYEVQFKPTGSTKWYQAGSYTTANTGATFGSFYTFISGSSISINTFVAGTARYFVWEDKVNY